MRGERIRAGCDTHQPVSVGCTEGLPDLFEALGSRRTKMKRVLQPLNSLKRNDRPSQRKASDYDAVPDPMPLPPFGVAEDSGVKRGNPATKTGGGRIVDYRTPRGARVQPS